MEHVDTAMSATLLIVRVFLGGMIFAHGFYKVFRGGKLDGTAKWFDSIGMRPGRLNAALAALTELGTGVLLVLGFFTPIAAGALIALMVVAIVTVHRKNGFFVFNNGQGIEYCLAIAVMSLVPATFGAGKYSIDHLIHGSLFHWLAVPSHGLAVGLILGVGGSFLQLAGVYRPNRTA